MIIEGHDEKNVSYDSNGAKISSSDARLGEDMIYYLNKWRASDEEIQEIYSNNRMNYQESKKNEVPKKKSIKKKIFFNKKTLAVLSFVAIGAVGVEHYRCAGYIANQVIESGAFPYLDTMSFGNYNDGIIISYLDSYGKRQSPDVHDYVQMVIQNGIENGFTVDQVAIAVDYLGFCDASKVEGSSLLGRIGHELIAASQLNENVYEQSSGGRDR